MPHAIPKNLIEEAEAAVAYAQQVRAYHRRRTQKGNAQRKKDVKLALKRIKEAMVPIRTEIGKFPYGPQTPTADNNRAAIRAASFALQTERRKLWKMQ